jgi:hypothetical protein
MGTYMGKLRFFYSRNYRTRSMNDRDVLFFCKGKYRDPSQSYYVFDSARRELIPMEKSVKMNSP